METKIARPVARRASHVRRRRTVHPQGRLRFATGIVLMIALATAAFGVEGYMRSSRSQHHVAALQAELASLQQRVGADEQAVAGERHHTRTVVVQASAVRRLVQRVKWQLQSVPTEAQLAGLRSEVASYAACVPQLQNEIEGLRLSWRIDAAKPSTDSFKLFSTAPASASCH
ncbi:MAG TPA: hypothetical protein VMJ65_00720 [Solirubrobacteraceae bacterium]|nr:hypothetical protein [Solirubrobacteraceae bacterium]